MSLTAYDALAYGGGTHPDTSPNRLAGMARLLGVAAPPPATARVLDLGCGAGRNLIPLAWYWPQARFVGVDLAQTPIDEGNAAIRTLGLDNIELRQGDVTQLDAARIGRFDYVIAHGLFSWVPQPVRLATLKLIADVLTPDGVAFVSYNALPGCRIRHVARDLMRFHLKGHAYDPSIVPPARALMDSIRALPEGPAPAFLAALRTEAKHATANGDASLFHDDLSPENQPFYLHEFADLAAAHGLAWFGDADAETMADPDGGPEVRAWLERVSAGSALARQQYLDFLNANRFSRALLCHADRAPSGGIALDAAADARWTTTLQDVEELAAVQRGLLDKVAGSLKPGGRLIYAVCTLARRETTDLAAAFTAAHPELVPIPLSAAGTAPSTGDQPRSTGLTLWPHELHANGMFIAGWRRP